MTLSEEPPSSVGAIAAGGGPADPGDPLVPSGEPSTDRQAPIGIPISGGEDPTFMALRADPAGVAGRVSADAARPGPDAKASSWPLSGRPGPSPSTGTSGQHEAAERNVMGPSPVGGSPGTGEERDIGGTSDRAGDSDPSGPCDEERALADECCEVATRAREHGAAADESLRAARRAYEQHDTAAGTAGRAADPRAVRQAKDEAQVRFRSSRTRASTSEAVEAAARDWLEDINRINSEARQAHGTMLQERAEAEGLGAGLERLALEADIARIAAETAEAACLAAREALAACQETIEGDGGHHPTVPSGAPIGPDDAEPLAAALGGGPAPRIFRMLRGDRATMTEVVVAMAGDDPTDRRRWQLILADLVDAIVADSIDASVLDFPTDHPFWGPFTIAQDREIAAALSSLGYRFDGLGGWLDDRVPSQRELALALGYAGLDPMRNRHWPTEAEMSELFREVTVAADEHLAGEAGDLLLGELVSMLGKRADALAEVWNQWGRLRPLLLDDR